MLKGKGAPPLFLARPRKRAYRKKARSTKWLEWCSAVIFGTTAQAGVPQKSKEYRMVSYAPHLPRAYQIVEQSGATL